MRITRSMYPAVGDRRVCLGTSDGVWCTWERNNSEAPRLIPHPSQARALEVYDSLVEVLKLELEGVSSNDN